jgi:acyl-[acyl-carrier-protein]-phospholipid O-acyltransferase/long-chain-fatty-acid--[acyl-carrier-protein] ligase
VQPALSQLNTRLNGAERLPAGPCVLVGEHFTPFDAALIHKLLPGATLVAGAPAYTTAGPDVLVGSPDDEAVRDKLKAALAEGKRVCVLLDAHLTKGGEIPGLQAALELGAPVVPICFDGPWSNRYKEGVEDYLLPRRGKAPVSLSIGHQLSDYGDSPQPAFAMASAGRPRGQSPFLQSLLDIEAEVWLQRQRDLAPLSFSMVSRLREQPEALALADAIRGPVTRIKALTGAVAIARAMKPHWGDQPRVGLLLPPSVGGALANMAAMLQGRAVVNLNYTTGREGMESAVRQAGLKTVLASKQFLHKGKIEPPANAQLIYLEDVARTIGGFAKLKALLAAKYLPYGRLLKFVGALREAGMDDDHAIIFSSGSTGEPKGIPVTHFNIISNIEQASRSLDLDSHDSLVHMLPFFHTFGNFLLWAGLHWGAGMIFLPNPLDADAVGEMTQKYKASILVATPTFFQIYAKKCTPEQLKSLRIIVAGAEKLPQPFAAKWLEKYGTPISEGYGCTECSPVIGVNVPDYKGQRGSLSGSIGRPLPGIQVRILDPETRQPVPLGEPGLLEVKGPNVMRGYLDNPAKSAEVLKDGWYSTGDIVKQDADGFLTITDRLSRFSKIGGEMVPHGKVEEALHLVIGAHEQIFAVTCVRDEKKGERLAVLHCNCTHEIEIVVKGLQEQGLPNIFIPKPRDFIPVQALPVLGTGKMDLRAIKQIASERLNGG